MKTYGIILFLALCLSGAQLCDAQVFIQNDGIMACTGSPVITIQNGNFINDGNFVAASSNVVFNGTGQSAFIGGSQPTIFHTLTLDKNGQMLSLNVPAEVRSVVIFQNGLFNLNGFDLALKYPANLVDERDESRIIGPNGGEIVLQLTLEPFLTSNPGNMGIRIFSPQNPGLTTIRRGHAQTPIGSNLSAKRYFSIEPANNSGLDAIVRMYYLEPECSHITEAELTFWRSDDGVAWEEMGVSTRDEAANFVEISGLDHLSTFTLSNASAVLPVEWLSFRAFVQDDDSVLLKWETAHEHDNLGFDVERQLPGGTAWEKLGFVAAAADYRFTDKTPLAGTNFYRLKQRDNDGSFSYSPIVSAEIATEAFDVSVYPNPASDRIHVRTGRGVVSLKIFDALGRQVLEQTVSDEPLVQLPVDRFPPGTYWLEAQMQGRTKRVKWVKS